MKALVAVISFMALSITFSGDATAASCEYDLIKTKRNGDRVVVGEPIQVRSRYMNRNQACMEARRDCREEKRYRTRNIRRGNRRAVSFQCREVRVRSSRRGYNRVERRAPRIVTRSCSYTFIRKDPRKTNLNYTGYATGRLGSGVRGLACDDALAQCLVRDLVSKGRCVKNN